MKIPIHGEPIQFSHADSLPQRLVAGFARELLLAFLLCATAQVSMASPDPHGGEMCHESRVVSVYISQDFINQQLSAHAKSETIKDLKIELVPGQEKILLRGKIQIPVEELRAINLDAGLDEFIFQVSIRPGATKQGHLILDFPLAETFFYPANSQNISEDRVVLPVQMLSLALASARGYLAALSGDFSGFDRRTKKYRALMKTLDRAIAHEKNPEVLDELKTKREATRLQLAAVPIERKQLNTLSKEVEHILSFTGEKEINLNDDLVARKNALILKLKLSQLTPFLEGVELGGFRIMHDRLDGKGENYFAVDINSVITAAVPPASSSKSTARSGLKTAPSLIIRINQSLFESESLLQIEKKDLGSKLKNLQFRLMDDGLHVSGELHKFFFTIPFQTVVDFASTSVDVFEMRVREFEVAGLDFEFLTNFILEAMKNRLDRALKGICQFRYVGEEKDHARALEVRIDPKSLVPAFPDLHLVEVDIRDSEFLLKVGQP